MYVDQQARDMANRAIALIEAHERICTERANAAALWRQTAGVKLEAIEENTRKAVGGVYNRLWLAGTGLVGVLLAVIAYLVDHKGL